MPRILGQRLAFAAGVFVLLVGVPNPAQQKRPDLYLRENKIPERAKMELEQADKFELLSLRPVVRGGDFHGYQVLGKTEILDAETRKSRSRRWRMGPQRITAMRCCVLTPGMESTSLDTTRKWIL